MQSLKSRLPQSPFSPAKLGANGPFVALPESTEDSLTAQEPSATETLPGEALLQQGSSTVALTLTEVNGETTQPELIEGHSEEQVTQIEATGTNDVQSTLESAKQMEPLESSPPESVDVTAPVASSAPSLVTPEELVTAMIQEFMEPQVPATEGAATDVGSPKPSSILNADPIQSQSPVALESTQPQIELPSASDVIVEQTAEAVPDALLPEIPTVHEEAAGQTGAAEVFETASPTQEKDDIVVNTETDKEDAAPALTKSKSKKKRFEFAHLRKSHQPHDGKNEEALLSPRACKNQLLAEKLRHVMQQVRAKVKKDRESNKTQEFSAEQNTVDA